MKIIPLKKYLRNKQKPLCPKCKVEMGFDCNIMKKNIYRIPFRKKHNDAIFECECCRGYYVVLDYTEDKTPPTKERKR